MFILYRKQHAWLQNRIVKNELLENKIIVKEVKESVLTDCAFAKEVITPVISKIDSIIGNSEHRNSLSSFTTQMIKSPTRKSTYISKNGEENKISYFSRLESIVNLEKRDMEEFTENSEDKNLNSNFKRVKQNKIDKYNFPNGNSETEKGFKF